MAQKRISESGISSREKQVLFLHPKKINKSKKLAVKSQNMSSPHKSLQEKGQPQQMVPLSAPNTKGTKCIKRIAKRKEKNNETVAL